MNLGIHCYIKKEEKTLMLHRIKKENDMFEALLLFYSKNENLEAGESLEECCN